jgi:perosamine synthetase
MPEPTPAASPVTLPFPRADRYHDAQEQVLSRMRSGRLSDTTRGAAIAALEDAFAELAQTRYALSFNSGTASLHGGLHAAGARPDAGVAVSPMTWISALTAVFHAGSYPIFCDLEPGSPNLAPTALSAAGPDASAALVTHAWGIPARMDALLAAADVPLIEDCSHAHGALYLGKAPGVQPAASALRTRKPSAAARVAY